MEVGGEGSETGPLTTLNEIQVHLSSSLIGSLVLPGGLLPPPPLLLLLPSSYFPLERGGGRRREREREGIEKDKN